MTNASRKATFFMFAQAATDPEMSHTFTVGRDRRWELKRNKTRGKAKLGLFQHGRYVQTGVTRFRCQKSNDLVSSIVFPAAD